MAEAGRALSLQPVNLAEIPVAELLAAASARGVDLAQHAYRLSKDSPRAKDLLAASFSIPASRAGQWIAVGTALCARLADPTQTQLRSEAIAAARTSGLSMDVLTVINTAVGNLLPKAPIRTEELRLELTRQAAGKTPDTVKSLANSRVRELNRGVEPAPNTRRRYFRSSAAADAFGMKYATVRLPEAEMSHLVRRLSTAARKLRAADGSLSHQQAMADALLAQAGPGDSGNAWLRQAAVLITMDDLQGNGDGTYATTDGALITPAEYAATKLAPFGLCLVYDDKAEPVDLFRIKRTANDKQRAIVALDQLLCPGPECARTAESSQVHHIDAWSRGGPTNLANLVGACATHNARNDDDPGRPPRNGRLVRCPDSGRPGWQPPDGKEIVFNPHPIMKKSGREWALSKRSSAY